MYPMYVPGAIRGWKLVSDPVELELQSAVNHHVYCWELNLGPIQEQPVLLVIASTSL